MELLLYLMSILLVTFWIIIWIMHLCALTNAKLKLNKRSINSAASKRKRKLAHLREKFLSACMKSTTTSAPTQSPPQQHPTVDLCSILQKQQAANQSNCMSLKDNIIVSQRGQENCYFDYNDVRSYHHHHHQQQQQSTLPLNSNEDSLAYATGAVNNNNNKENCNKPNDKFTETTTDYYQSYHNLSLPLPGVSIIKPLVGVDRNLYQNLETFFQLDYPIFELLFCVQDPNDAAVEVVKQLINKYSNIDARLFTGGSRVGVNPKINNMQPAYEATKYELLLISDSGISMRKDTLLDMVDHMRDDVALVHQMPFVLNGRKGFQALVERVYFGTAHARAYLTADLLNINCPTGMSALMRKSLLDEVGGIKAFGQYLAEDFFFAKSFTDRGWKISISSQPALQNSANSSDNLSTLNSRIQRWIKLRLVMVPHWTILEPFSECMLLGFLGAISMSFLLALNPVPLFLLHVIIWILLDYKLLSTIQDGPLMCTKTDFLLAWLVRECTALPIFSKALASSEVTWRSRIFKLRWGGCAEELIPEPDKCDAITKSETLNPNEQQNLNPLGSSNIGTCFNHVPPILCNEQSIKTDLACSTADEPSSINYDFDCRPQLTNHQLMDMAIVMQA